MKFKELRDLLFLEKEEIIINKKINVQGKEMLLLSLMKGLKCNKLWAIYINELNCTDEFEEVTLTNREERVRTIQQKNIYGNIHFTQMTIQNQKITFQSSSTNGIDCLNNEEMIILQHFIKKGMISNEYDELPLENITLVCYEQTEGEDFPEINKNEKVVITLETYEEIEEVLIQHPFKISIGKSNENTKIYYMDEKSNEKDFFYLNEVEKYDIWKDYQENLDSKLKDIEESQREEVKTEYLECVKCHCPEGMDLLTMSYETEDGTRLNFLTKEYLESVYYVSSNAYMFLAGDNEEGVNGHAKYLEYLKPVEKDFNEEIEIELFSKYVNRPKQTIRLEI